MLPRYRILTFLGGQSQVAPSCRAQGSAFSRRTPPRWTLRTPPWGPIWRPKWARAGRVRAYALCESPALMQAQTK